MVSMIDIGDSLLHASNEVFSGFGFNDYCFMVIAKEHGENKKLPSLTNIDIRFIRKQRYVLASSLNAFNARGDYFRNYGFYDERITSNRMKLGPVIWQGIDRGVMTGLCVENVFHKYGVNTVVTWTVELHGNLVGGYTMMSNLTQEKVSAIIDMSADKIELELKLFGNYFLQEYCKQLNPIQNFDCLSKNSILVLKLLSEGLDVDEISKSLFITTRGVCYHIDKLKSIFDCRGRYQVVNKACKLGLI